jgi:hypothetical protein
LIGYIFYIIDCNICWDIFNRIDIIDYHMYSDVSCRLRLLYSIYTNRSTIQLITNNYTQFILGTINITTIDLAFLYTKLRFQGGMKAWSPVRTGLRPQSSSNTLPGVRERHE